MKTRGLVVAFGYVAGESLSASGSWEGHIPIQFWNRLKMEVQRQGLVEEFKAQKAAVVGQEGLTAAEREMYLFELWFRRLGFTPEPGHYEDQELWPWTRGWTEELVDSYLVRGAA